MGAPQVGRIVLKEVRGKYDRGRCAVLPTRQFSQSESHPRANRGSGCFLGNLCGEDIQPAGESNPRVMIKCKAPSLVAETDGALHNPVRFLL